MMTKKQFEAIAKLLNPYNTGVTLPREREIAEKITLDISDFLETQNPNFNRMRFYLACGLELSK